MSHSQFHQNRKVEYSRQALLHTRTIIPLHARYCLPGGAGLLGTDPCGCRWTDEGAENALNICPEPEYSSSTIMLEDCFLRGHQQEVCTEGPEKALGITDTEICYRVKPASANFPPYSKYGT